MTYIVVYSQKNNKPWENPVWHVVVEGATLDQANKAYANYVDMAENGELPSAWPYGDPITQVAIFKECPGCFRNKPKYNHDQRDKSDWPVGSALAGIINTVQANLSFSSGKK